MKTLANEIVHAAAERVVRRGYVVPAGLAAMWLGAVLVAPFTDDVLSAVEERVAPVVANAEISSIVPDGDGGVVITGRATKLRNCGLEEIEWYKLDPAGRRTRVEARRVSTSGPKPAGKLAFGPWEVKLPPDTLLKSSEAFLVHRCHAGWDTRSKIWEAKR